MNSTLLSNPPLNLAIIGYGLIGSSIAKCIKKNPNASSKIIIRAYDLKTESIQNQLKECQKKGEIDEVGQSDFSDLNQVDFIVICTPVGTMLEVFKKIQLNAKPSCIITDTGSTKNSVVEAAKTAYQKIPANFVPAHPLAGSEITGLNTGRFDLFQHKLCLICHTEQTSSLAIDLVEAFWSLMGARIDRLELLRHDNLLAHTSHLPHLLSYCLVNVLLDCDDNILDFASSGFAGISRLASSDPQLWFDILSHNKKDLFIALDNLQSDLSKAKQSLLNEDQSFLIEYFSRAKKARDAHVKKYPEIFK